MSCLYVSPRLGCRHPKQKTAAAGQFFERLDTKGDGKVTLDKAPEQGKMLVEFLLSQLGKKGSDALDQAEFRELTSRLAHRHPEGKPKDEAVDAAIEAGVVRPASENCPACSMGLTAEFVVKRLDVDEDKFVTVTEFTRSPGMQDLAKAREAVGRLDKNGDGKLSWEEFETAYKIRHANCKKPDPATPAANAEAVHPAAEIRRLDRHEDPHLRRELDHRWPSQKLRLSATKSGTATPLRCT